MKTVNIKIGQSNTTNIGDFSNIKPNVEISISDVPIESAEEVTDILSYITSMISSQEFHKGVIEADSKGIIVRHGLLEQLDNVKIDYDAEIHDGWKGLQEVLGK